MRFADFLRPDPFLESQCFAKPCSPLPDTTQYQAAPRPDEVDCKVYKTLAFQKWIWTRRKSAKRIIFM